MPDTLLPPTQVQLRKASGMVMITWRNGECTQVSGDQLRQYCACSQCRARQVVGLRLIGESTEVTAVRLMGSTGIQVVFSDGHDRGIFPWDYLRRIAEGSALEAVYE